MSEIKLKESEFNEIKKFIQECYHSAVLDSMINDKAKEKGWIVENEIKEAIEELNNYYDAFDYADTYNFVTLYNLSCKVINLLEERIQELEVGK